MQGATRQVEGDGGLRIAQPHFNGSIGMLGIHIGPSVARLGHTVAERVFYFQCRELGIAQLVVNPRGTHRHRGTGSQNRLPRQRANTLVEHCGIRSLHTAEHHGDTTGQPRPQTHPQPIDRLPVKRYAALQRPCAAHLERLQLVGQQRFNSRQAGSEKLMGCKSRHKFPQSRKGPQISGALQVIAS